MLTLLLLVAVQDPAWERPFTDANDLPRRVFITGEVVVALMRTRLDTFELATGKTLTSIPLPSQMGPATTMEFAGNAVLIQTILIDLKTGKALATDLVENGGRASGAVFYGWSDEKLVKVAGGHAEWSLPLKDSKGVLLPAADGGVVVRVPHAKGGAESAKAYYKVSAAGKIEWNVAIPEADILGMEQIRSWAISDDGKDLYLMCGTVKGTPHALWTAVIDGKAKRIVLKEVSSPLPRMTQALLPHIARREGDWCAVGGCIVEVEADKKKVKVPGLLVVNLSDGKELRRVPTGAAVPDDPAGIVVQKENEIFDLFLNRSLGKFGGEAVVAFAKSFAYVKEGPKMRWLPLAGGAVVEAEFQGSLGRSNGDFIAAQTREGQKTAIGCFDLAAGKFLRGGAYEGNVQSWVDAVGEGVVLHGMNERSRRLIVAGKKK